MSTFLCSRISAYLHTYITRTIELPTPDYIHVNRSDATATNPGSGKVPKACSHRMTGVTLTDGTFDLLDEHCDGQDGLHTHFACQRNGIRRGSFGVNRP